MFLLLFSFRSVGAQQTHFIYIQTDNKQPFYIRYEKKIYSSSVSGYLIIPKLTDGNYDFLIGFPKNEWPEQNIHCVVNKKDLGYILKNFGERGWGFFNMQNMEVLMALKKEPEGNTAVAEYRTDAFSTVLSNVVNDPSIRQKEVIKDQEEIKTAEAVTLPPAIQEHAPDKQAVLHLQRSEIITVLKTINKEGTQLVYIDKTPDGNDTITIFIPPGVKQVSTQTAEVKKIPDLDIRQTPMDRVETVEKAPEQKIPVTITTVPVKDISKEDTKKTADKKFIDIELPNPNSSDTNREVVKSISPKVVLANTDCKATASEDDFLKLRKKMAAAENDEAMITAAKKVFRSKCFITEQIKNLSVLFLTDAGKFMFFETAYPFVTDSSNFVLLQGQLTEDTFISRFKTMVRH
ncbi:MAG: DUF4476 domain-containing protein [Ferruginibacter sp.]